MWKKILLIFLLAFMSVGAASALAFWFTQEKTLEIVPNDMEVELSTVDFSVWREKEQEQILQMQLKARQIATVFMVGDIMLSRAVERTMIAKNDFMYCLADMRKTVQGADLAFGNLESPIIAGQPVEDDSFVFRAHPESAKALQLTGFDILGLANNHIGNYGTAGLNKTFEYLRAQGIDWVGAGENMAQMVNPLIKQVRDLKIAFLAYAYGPTGYGATNTRPGMALINSEQLLVDIQEAKDLGAQVIIMTMHAGVEYEIEPTNQQRELAHLAIDNGVDLVVGHHPHVVQRREVYQGKPIYYSLGNFVFDQMWSLETRQGLGVMFTIDQSGVIDTQLVPVMIENYCRPRIAMDDEANEIIARLDKEKISN